MGAVEQALGRYTALCRLEPDNPVYFVRSARLFERCGDVSSAVDSMRNALRLDDGQADWYVYLARLLRGTRARAEAVDAYRAAISRQNNKPEWQVELAMLLERLGDVESARTHYARAFPNRRAKLRHELSYVVKHGAMPFALLARDWDVREAEMTIRWLRRQETRPGTNRLLGRYDLQRLPSDDENLTIEHLEAGSEYTFREPRSFGEIVEPAQRRVAVPPKWIATVDQALVFGAFQVIANGKLVVHEPAADPHIGFVAGNWPNIVALKDNPAQAMVIYSYDRVDQLAEGILLSGRTTPNYFHCLIEHLAKAYVLSKKPELRHVPLIVDSDLLPQQFESLELALPGRPVFRRSTNTLLKVERLHIPSQHTFHPDETSIPFWSGGAICTKSLAYLRDTILSGTGYASHSGSRLVFLSRGKGQKRNTVNVDQVEDTVAAAGFEIVDPGLLSFRDQVKLFREARAIVGPMGAAFSNVIFCNSGTRILSLFSPFFAKFVMQANIADFAGCDYRVLSGIHPIHGRNPSVTVTPYLMHDDFEIDVDELERAIAALLEG